MNAFHPGELATIHGMNGPSARFNGTRCEILSPVIASIAKHVDSGAPMYVDGHRAMTIEGETYIIPVSHLKRQASRRACDYVVSWRECEWMPKEMRT